MVDKINESIDIVVQLFDGDDDDDDNGIDENQDTTCTYNDQDQTEENEESKKEKHRLIRIPEYRLNARPLYFIQKDDIKSIRQTFKKQNRLLLNTYKSNAMYSCTKNDFEEKISTFMTQTNAYHLIEELNETNPHCVQKHLDDLVNKIKILLDNLLQQQSITSIQYQEMKIIRGNVRLDYLFFLPDTRKDDIPVQPIMISCESAIISMARLLNRLLEPIYDRVAFNQTFFKAADAVQALEVSMKNNYLQSKTLFSTLHIKNILSIFPHEKTIKIVEHFLHDHVPTKEIQGISITTIIQLLQFILANQWFVYQNKLYRQIHGGSSGIQLMSLLVNIILYDWQQEFVTYLQDHHAIFGRCFDQIFLTWNESKDKLDTFIHRMNMKHSYIRIESVIGTQIDYLDASIRYFSDDAIENVIELETQVNHQSKAEPYALPYIQDCPQDIYSKLIRAALIRAARCCLDIYEFQQERQYIELSFAMNNFPMDFINEHVTVFFLEFNMEEFDYNMYEEEIYQQLRKNVIEYEKKCLEKRMKQHDQAHEYNLQYISLSTKRSNFKHLKQYNQRHRKHRKNNHSKFYVELFGRPKYPSNTK